MFGQCQYELTLLDSYGDGWNGNSINVQVTGFAPSNLTLNSGSSISYTIGINLSETISFSWQGGTFSRRMFLYRQGFIIGYGNIFLTNR